MHCPLFLLSLARLVGRASARDSCARDGCEEPDARPPSVPCALKGGSAGAAVRTEAERLRWAVVSVSCKWPDGRETHEALLVPRRPRTGQLSTAISALDPPPLSSDNADGLMERSKRPLIGPRSRGPRQTDAGCLELGARGRGDARRRWRRTAATAVSSYSARHDGRRLLLERALEGGQAGSAVGLRRTERNLSCCAFGGGGGWAGESWQGEGRSLQLTDRAAAPSRRRPPSLTRAAASQRQRTSGRSRLKEVHGPCPGLLLASPRARPRASTHARPRRARGPPTACGRRRGVERLPSPPLLTPLLAEPLHQPLSKQIERGRARVPSGQLMGAVEKAGGASSRASSSPPSPSPPLSPFALPPSPSRHAFAPRSPHGRPA